MKKKTAIILCTAVILLFAAVYTFYASFNGSLIKKTIMTGKAKSYVAQTYPGQDLNVSFSVYDFKCSAYFCRVQSPVSEDTAFDVYETRDGNMADDYDLSVTNKENTISRLSRQLDIAVEQVFLPAYPHRTRLAMCDFYSETEFDRSKFELDMPLDLTRLPHPAELTIWVETSHVEPTWEEAAELLREAVRITEELNMDIRYFSISVEYPYREDDDEIKPIEYSSIVGADAVPKETILGDGLEELLDSERQRREQELIDLEKADELEKYQEDAPPSNE